MLHLKDQWVLKKLIIERSHGRSKTLSSQRMKGAMWQNPLFEFLRLSWFLFNPTPNLIARHAPFDEAHGQDHPASTASNVDTKRFYIALRAYALRLWLRAQMPLAFARGCIFFMLSICCFAPAKRVWPEGLIASTASDVKIIQLIPLICGNLRDLRIKLFSVDSVIYVAQASSFLRALGVLCFALSLECRLRLESGG